MEMLSGGRKPHGSDTRRLEEAEKEAAPEMEILGEVGRVAWMERMPSRSKESETAGENRREIGRRGIVRE